MNTKKYNLQFRSMDNLQLLFIGLKLTNYINWSWLWVLAPLWICGLIFIIIGTILITTE